MTTTTGMPIYRGINASFREYATREEIAGAAQSRLINRQGIRRLAISQGRARVGDYVKGVQYAYANGRFLSAGHKAVEGRVVAVNANGRLTILRGDGQRFTILADDKSTRGLGWNSIARYTPERLAKAKEIKASRNG